jgi:hypothetical protein
LAWLIWIAFAQHVSAAAFATPLLRATHDTSAQRMGLVAGGRGAASLVMRSKDARVHSAALDDVTAVTAAAAAASSAFPRHLPPPAAYSEPQVSQYSIAFTPYCGQRPLANAAAAAVLKTTNAHDVTIFA